MLEGLQMRKLKFIYITLIIVLSIFALFWVTNIGVAQEPTPETEPESENETEGGTKFISNEELGILPQANYTVTLGAWRNMRPTESKLQRISMLPADIEVNCYSDDQLSKGWIVGDAGTILGYCNGVWEQYIGVESIATTLYDVQAINNDLAVAVGEDGAILLYIYDEITDDWAWIKAPIMVEQGLVSVHFVYDNTTGKYHGFVVGQANSNGKGVIMKGELTPTTKNGHRTYIDTWTNLTSLYPSFPTVDYYHDVVMLSRTNGWAVGGDEGYRGVILHWNGSAWSVDQIIGTNIIRGILMLSANEGWAVGSAGVIYHYDGNDWSSVSSPTTNNLLSIGVDAEGTIWAVGSAGTILKYINGQWTLFTDLRTDPFDFRALDFNSGHGWLVGMNMNLNVGGHILEYDDGAWVAVTVPTDNRLNGISNVSENDAWAVGFHDSLGGTIIHWDGQHWQRWYQKDVPIPPVDLYAIEMVSENDGWAAGDPKVTDGPAVILHWDGRRWSELSYPAPVNVRIYSIAMLNSNFGWATASNGNAVARWNRLSGYWIAPHTCGGVWYNLRGASIAPKTNYEYGDAWSVGDSLNPVFGEAFLRYMDGCSNGYAWDVYSQPGSPDSGQTDGPYATDLRGISVVQGPDGTWGYAVGNYKSRACIYSYSDTTGIWSILHCDGDNDSGNKPSRFYSTDIIEESGVGWFGGYYDRTLKNDKKSAFIAYLDYAGYSEIDVSKIFPLNGMNIYHRPILSLDMVSDTMGWAVGSYGADAADGKNLSVIYQYPYPNFTLDIYPETQVIKPGDSTSYTITVNSIGGFDANVALSIPYTPSGISANINPTTTNSEESAYAYLDSQISTPIGQYEIPMLGNSEFQSGDYPIPVWRSFDLNLIVTNNPIYSIVPSHGPVSTTFTINGEGFGSDPGVGNRSTSLNHVIWGSNVIEGGIQLADSYIHSWSDTQITFQVPDDPSLFTPERFPLIGNVAVTANGESSNDNLTFQLDNYISGVDAIRNSGKIIGTIYGTSFGNDPGETYRSTYYEHINLGSNWVDTFDVLFWSNNVITFTTTSFSPVTLTVTSNGFESNSVMFPPGAAQVFLPMTIR